MEDKLQCICHTLYSVLCTMYIVHFTVEWSSVYSSAQWSGALVDHPTQLICIWIFIQTNTKDIAGQSSASGALQRQWLSWQRINVECTVHHTVHSVHFPVQYSVHSRVHSRQLSPTKRVVVLTEVTHPVLHYTVYTVQCYILPYSCTVQSAQWTVEPYKESGCPGGAM